MMHSMSYGRKHDLESAVKAIFKSWKSVSKYHHSSDSNKHWFVQHKEVFRVLSPLLDMFSRDFDLCLRESRSGRIVKPGLQAMIVCQPLCIKDNVLRGAAMMTVDSIRFGCLSGLKYGESLVEPVCVCGFDMALSARYLIEFDDPVRPVMDCIEQPSIRQLIRCRIISLF